MKTHSQRGFTLVEGVIVVVVIAVLLAALIPVMRERERARLQVLADTEPWEVFEFLATPAKKSFAADEDLVIVCEIENPTKFPLSLPSVLNSFHLTFGDTGAFVGSVRSLDLIPKTAIAPGESIPFDVRFHPIGTGTANTRLVYGRGIALFITNGRSVSISGKLLEGNIHGRMAITNLQGVLPAEGGTVRIEVDHLEIDPGGSIEFSNLRGILSWDEKPFQSNPFQLSVEESDDSDLFLTFDQIIENLEQWE